MFGIESVLGSLRFSFIDSSPLIDMDSNSKHYFILEMLNCISPNSSMALKMQIF